VRGWGALGTAKLPLHYWLETGFEMKRVDGNVGEEWTYPESRQIS
jgi:hypothetical protein